MDPGTNHSNALDPERTAPCVDIASSNPEALVNGPFACKYSEGSMRFRKTDITLYVASFSDNTSFIGRSSRKASITSAGSRSKNPSSVEAIVVLYLVIWVDGVNTVTDLGSRTLS